MKLLLTRHGQSRWQTDGDSAGADSPLSPLGVAQAQRLGEFLQQHGNVDRIVASPLARAYQTATLAADYLGLPVAVDPDLREFESAEAGEPPRPVSLWDVIPLAPAHPDYVAFSERVGAALTRIAGDGTADETVLIVAHGGTVGTALRLLFGSPVLRIWTANTALHGLRWTGEYWVVRYINRQDHLPRPLRSR